MCRFGSLFSPGTNAASKTSDCSFNHLDPGHLKADDASSAHLGKPTRGMPESLGGTPELLGGGGVRKFFCPLSYVADYPYPLIIWLHSDRYNEDQINQVMPHISVRNFVGVGVRATRAIDQHGRRFEWSTSSAGVGQAHDAVIGAMDAAKQRFSVHPGRIILAGYGSGGVMALRIAMRDPQRFAGVASLGGRMPQNAIRCLNTLRRRGLPMLWQWAVGNENYTQSGLNQDCRMAMAIGSKVEIRQYPTEDEMDTVVLSDLNAWVMQKVIPENRRVVGNPSTAPRLYSVN